MQHAHLVMLIRPASILSVSPTCSKSSGETWLKPAGYILPEDVPFYLDVSFDIGPWDSTSYTTIPSCCAWSISGLSSVISKLRYSGWQAVLEAFEVKGIIIPVVLHLSIYTSIHLHIRLV